MLELQTLHKLQNFANAVAGVEEGKGIPTAMMSPGEGNTSTSADDLDSDSENKSKGAHVQLRCAGDKRSAEIMLMAMDNATWGL